MLQCQWETLSNIWKKKYSEQVAEKSEVLASFFDSLIFFTHNKGFNHLTQTLTQMEGIRLKGSDTTAEQTRQEPEENSRK